ncbi:unnamed protein product [Amoebophrya sp. A120]|nr:unnamed protein product [Amoebophrya sp. A120]|eukprot:GSA120T00011996001.1
MNQLRRLFEKRSEPKIKMADQSQPTSPRSEPTSTSSSDVACSSSASTAAAAADNERTARDLLPADALIRRTFVSSSSASTLKGVPLFSRFPKEDMPVLAEAMQLKNFPADHIIFRQGDKGDAFYVIQKGEVEVLVHPQNYLNVGDKVKCLKDLHFGGRKINKGSLATVDKFDASREFPYTIRVAESGYRGRVLPEEVEPVAGPPPDKSVATLREGDYFGEQSLLKGAARAATVRTKGDVTTFCLTRDKFRQFNLSSKLHFAKRKAVVAPPSGEGSGEEDGSGSSKPREPLLPKTDAEKEQIKEGLRANSNLRAVMQINGEQMDALTQCAYKKSGIAKGETLIKQGELFAEKFYIVAEGTFEFSIAERPGRAGNEIDRSGIVGQATPGMSFGELALLYHAPRAATVTCVSEEASVWVIERQDFKHTLMQANDSKMATYMKVFDNVDLFNVLTLDEKVSLAEALTEVRYVEKDKIVVEGEHGDAFYILTEGSIDFLKGGKKVASITASPGGEAHWFGERALLKSATREATAVVTSASCSCLALTRTRFDHLLGPLQELMQKKIDEKAAPKQTPAMLGTRPKVDLNDLKRLGLLGCGGFGAVTLEKHKRTGDVYALKALSKGYIVKMKMQKGVMREKEILLLCQSKFIIALYQTFKSKEHLFFLLEPAMGGELFATYHKRRFHGSVSKARFYSASVVLAFEHLHERNIVFRDLKPENLLLDVKGFCKLTDMGLAKILTSGKTYTTCGTPDYFAPEVIQQTGMNKAVDWWTLGILIHELLSGHAPFDAKDPMETYQKIVRGVNGVNFSYRERDPDAMDLVKQLLKHCPSERLPMRSGGTKNLKEHLWYRAFDFVALESHTARPPYIPEVRGNTDMSNFRAQEADLPPQIPYRDPGTGWDDNF